MDEPAERKRSRRRGLSREETALFHAAMKDTRPLPGRRVEPPPEPAPPPADTPAAVVSPAPPPSVRRGRLPALEAGATVGVDGSTAERLRRGRLRPEARIDLHGHTLDDAHRALGAFLVHSQLGGRRCVLVITGHGAWRGGSALKRELPHWLNRPELRARVLAFTQAQPQDGGAGAFYVLLKRIRPGG